ncbi:Sec-independent protein translocase subunit TatA [Streptomyces sp. NPDC052040]|uniref:Sec-independent protein translocase subunit TatA n=1 Tax=unclassified Streptomyces TaxID=2593676 RepID=UPI0037CD6619
MLRNGLEPWHLLIVALVVIVVFGSKRLPDTARALGKSMRILKSEARAMRDEGAPSAATPESAPAPAPGLAPVAPAPARTSAEATTAPAPAFPAAAGPATAVPAAAEHPTAEPPATAS